MEVVFHLNKIFNIVLSSSRVDLQMLQSKFTSFLLFHYFSGRAGGRSTNSAQLKLELGLSLAKLGSHGFSEQITNFNHTICD